MIATTPTIIPQQTAAPAAPQQAPFQSASLYVGDLQSEANEGLLFELFSRVGPVASIRICRDAITRRSLGYAYVNFHNMQDAERALDTMNFTDIKGKACRIMWSQRDPTLRKSGVGNIFIKNLAKSIDNKSLFDTFSVFGNILSCKVVTDENGVSKGFGYVHYETAEAAQDSIKKLDGCQIEGETVNVLLYSRRAERAGNNEWTNVYMKQFPPSWSDEDLKAVVTVYGPVTSLLVQKDAEGKSKGFGFVNFETHAAAAAALTELNNKEYEVDGTKYTLYVSQAQKKADRQRELKRQMDVLKHEKILKLQGMNLFVKNLDDSITDDLLREHFAPFGTITSARVMKDDAAGGISKGFGFVCYSSAEEATRAMTEMNNKTLESKPITVNLHQRKEVRHAQLAASFNARAAMGGMGPGGARYAGNGAMPPYMAMYGQDGNNRGNFGRQFNGQGRGGMMPAGNQAYPIPAYAMQNQMRQGGQFPPNMMMQGGRGGRGGRGMMGGNVRNLPGGVKFNMQARNQNQPNMMGQMGGNMMPMPVVNMPNGDMQQSGNAPLDEIALAQAEPQMQKHMIGERLYPLIMQQQPQLAGKITGMLLEMDNAELLHLIESPDALMTKIEEALDVLHKHQAATASASA